MMTDEEVIETLKSDGPLNRARRVLSAAMAKEEQRMAQQKNISPIEMRRREFETVKKIAFELSHVTEEKG